MKHFIFLCLAMITAVTGIAQADSGLHKLHQLGLSFEQKQKLKLLMLDQKKEQLLLKEKYFRLMQDILTKEQLEKVRLWRETKKTIPRNTH